MTSYAAACCCSVDPEPTCEKWATMSFDYSIASVFTSYDPPPLPPLDQFSYEVFSTYNFTASGIAKMRFNSQSNFFSTVSAVTIHQPIPDVSYSVYRKFQSFLDGVPFGDPNITTKELDTSPDVLLRPWARIQNGFGISWNSGSPILNCPVSFSPEEYGLDAQFSLNVPYVANGSVRGVDLDATGGKNPHELRLIGDEEMPCELGELVYKRCSWHGGQIGLDYTMPECNYFTPGSYSVSSTDSVYPFLERTFETEVSYSISDIQFFEEEPEV